MTSRWVLKMGDGSFIEDGGKWSDGVSERSEFNVGREDHKSSKSRGGRRQNRGGQAAKKVVSQCIHISRNCAARRER